MSLKYANLMEWLEHKRDQARSVHSQQMAQDVIIIVSAATRAVSKNNVEQKQGLARLAELLTDSPEIQAYLAGELRKALEMQNATTVSAAEVAALAIEKDAQC